MRAFTNTLDAFKRFHASVSVSRPERTAYTKGQPDRPIKALSDQAERLRAHKPASEPIEGAVATDGFVGAAHETAE